MKFKLSLLTGFAFILLGYLCFTFIIEHKVKLPGKELGENHEEREKWEKLRLASPVTGKIPENIRFKELEFIKTRFANARMAEASTISWQQRGPWNIGGRTRAFAVDVTNEHRIFAGGVSGGLWKSEDDGNSWMRVSPTFEHPGVVSIVQDTRPGKTNNWYYLSGECYGTSASGGEAFYLGDGLFKSTNGGITWTSVSSTAGGNPNNFTSFFQTGWRIKMNPTDTINDVLFMATMGAVYRSLNGGTAWSAVRGGNTAAYSYFTDVEVTPAGVVYATLSSEGDQKGIWRSSNNGSTWANILPPNFPAVYNRFVIGVNPDNENEVYFLGSTPNSGNSTFFISDTDWQSLWKYTYISGNGTGAGGQWEDLSSHLPHTGTSFDKFSCQGGYDLVVKVQPGTGNVFIGGTSLYRSTDGFTTNNNITHIGGYKPGTTLPYFELYPNHHPDIHDIWFTQTPNTMYSASDGGVHLTMDCNASTVEWINQGKGYMTSQFYTVGFDKRTPGDPMMIGGLQDNANFYSNSTNLTDPWKMTINGDGAFLGVAENKSAYYFSIQQGKIAKCELDPAGNILAYNRIDPIGAKDYLFINPLVMDPNDDNLMYVAGGHFIWRNDMLNSLPLSNEWDSIATGWTRFPDSTAGQFSAISVSSNNPANRVYAGTSKNKIYRIDNANTGTPAMTDISIPAATNADGYVNCLAIDPTDGSKVVAVYSNYDIYSLFYTEDAGTTWKKAGGNLEVNTFGTGNAPSIRWVSILPLSDGSKKYFAGTSTGLYSADSLSEHTVSTAGTFWSWENPMGIGTTVVNMVETRQGDGLVAVATHGNGIFTANLENFVGIAPETDALTEIRTYPNPASESFLCEWATTHPALYEWEMVDITGRKIQGQKLYISSAGNQSLTVNTASLTDGIYFYQLKANGILKGRNKIVIKH
ncbi:MAG: T9SS type A sorting domain-containing protein [Bacteroidia bacterium]|nr:T9SS type A sorting domain-containing protein [Bacteroidia bacterium]